MHKKNLDKRKNEEGRKSKGRPIDEGKESERVKNESDHNRRGT